MASKYGRPKSSNVLQIDDQKGKSPTSSEKNRTGVKIKSSSTKKSNKKNKKSTTQTLSAATSEKTVDEDKKQNSIINLNKFNNVDGIKRIISISCNEIIEEEKNDENMLAISLKQSSSYTLVRNIEGLSEDHDDQLQRNLQTLRLMKVSSIPKIDGKPSFVVLENKVYKRNLDDPIRSNHLDIKNSSMLQLKSQKDVASQTENVCVPEKFLEFRNSIGCTTSEIIGHNAKSSKLLLMNELNMRTFHMNTERTRTMQHVMNLDTIKHIIPQKFIATKEVKCGNSVTSHLNRCSSTISQGTNVFRPYPTLHTSAVPNRTPSRKSLSDSYDKCNYMLRSSRNSTTQCDSVGEMLQTKNISNKTSECLNVSQAYNQTFYEQNVQTEPISRNNCHHFEEEASELLSKRGKQSRNTQMLNASSSKTLIPEPSIGTQTNLSRLDLSRSMFDAQSIQINSELNAQFANNIHQYAQTGLYNYMPNIERVTAGMYSNIGAMSSSAPFRHSNYKRLPINNEQIGCTHSRFSNRSQQWIPQDCGIFYHNTPPVVPKVTSMQYSYASQQSFGMTRQYENAAYQNIEMPKHCGNCYRPCQPQQLQTFPARYACNCNNCVFPQELQQQTLPSYAEHPGISRSLPLHMTSQHFNMPANDTYAIHSMGNATHLPFNRGTFFVPFQHYSQMPGKQAFAWPHIFQATESGMPDGMPDATFSNMNSPNCNVYYDNMLRGEVLNISNPNIKNCNNLSNKSQSFKTVNTPRMNMMQEAAPRMDTKETEAIQRVASKETIICNHETRRKLPPPPVPPKRYKRGLGNTLRVLGLKGVKLPSQYSVRFDRSCLILRAVPTPVPKTMKRLNNYPSATVV